MRESNGCKRIKLSFPFEGTAGMGTCHGNRALTTVTSSRLHPHDRHDRHGFTVTTTSSRPFRYILPLDKRLTKTASCEEITG